MPDRTFDDAIAALFNEYLDSWNRADLPAYAACYTEPATLVLPTGPAVFPDHATIVAQLGDFRENLVRAGFDHTTIGPFSATRCGENLAIADLRELTRRRADRSIMEATDMHYVLHRQDGAWRIAVAVACNTGWQDAHV